MQCIEAPFNSPIGEAYPQIIWDGACIMYTYSYIHEAVCVQLCDCRSKCHIVECMEAAVE